MPSKVRLADLSYDTALAWLNRKDSTATADELLTHAEDAISAGDVDEAETALLAYIEVASKLEPAFRDATRYAKVNDRIRDHYPL